MRKIVSGTLKKEILVLAYKDCFKLYDTCKYISDDDDQHNNKDTLIVEFDHYFYLGSKLRQLNQ